MASQTSAEDTLDRQELATALHGLAEEFERGDDEIDVEVGNKHVTLSPGETVSYEIEVTERTSRLRKNREAIDLQLRWKTG